MGDQFEFEDYTRNHDALESIGAMRLLEDAYAPPESTKPPLKNNYLENSSTAQLFSSTKNFYESSNFPIGSIMSSAGDQHNHRGPSYKGLAEAWRTDRNEFVKELKIGGALTGALLTSQYLYQPSAIGSAIIGGIELFASDIPGMFARNATGQDRLEHAVSALTDIGLIVGAVAYAGSETRSLKLFALLAAATVAKAATLTLDD